MVHRGQEDEPQGPMVVTAALQAALETRPSSGLRREKGLERRNSAFAVGSQIVLKKPGMGRNVPNFMLAPGAASPRDSPVPSACPSEAGSARPSPVQRQRPWRKTAQEVKAEREAALDIVADSEEAAIAAGVDAQALSYCIRAQEALDASAAMGNAAAQAAVDSLRQTATNNRPREEVDEARLAVHAALRAAGLEESVLKELEKPRPGRSDVCHQVLPGLWLGGWTALNNNCQELQKRGVTHVVSVVSADQRRLPNFIRRHLHIHADDKEDAAQQLGERFPDICAFVDRARCQEGASVYVHCGAGISRGPTACMAYVMWKLGITAATALKIVEAARPCTRPNLGLVRHLRRWQSMMRSLPGCGSGGFEVSSDPSCVVSAPATPEEGATPLSPTSSGQSTEKDKPRRNSFSHLPHHPSGLPKGRALRASAKAC